MALAVAPNGAVAIAGRTSSQNFPVVRAAKSMLTETSPMLGDAVVAVLDSTGQFLQFSTYWGGSRDEEGHDIAVDSAGNVFVAGYTRSADLPVTAGSIDRLCGSDGACNGSFDAFVTKFSSTGGVLASSFFGGRDLDIARSIEVTGDGRLVLLGTTQSPDFPIVDAPPSPRTPAVNFEHTFLTAFDTNLTRVVRSGFVLDERFLPNVAVLQVRDGFAFVAGQVGQLTGLPSGIGTYIRATRLP